MTSNNKHQYFDIYSKKMSSRLNYDLIAPEAHKILTKLLSAKNNEEMRSYYTDYLNLLDAAGWDDNSFDAETFKRINDSWESKLSMN